MSSVRLPRALQPDTAGAASVADELFEMAMGRLGGDWGSDAIDDAAGLVESLAKERPDAMMWHEHTRRGRSFQEGYDRANAAETAHTAIDEDGLEI